MKQKTNLNLDNLAYNIFKALLLINYFNLIYIIINFLISKHYGN